MEDKIRNSWVDPRKSESDEKLLYEYKVAWAFAQAAEQILALVESMVDEAEALTKKEKGQDINKLRNSTI